MSVSGVDSLFQSSGNKRSASTRILIIGYIQWELFPHMLYGNVKSGIVFWLRIRLNKI